jgi:hypothetical protein
VLKDYHHRTHQHQQIQSVLGRNGFWEESTTDDLGKPSIGISCMQEPTQGAAPR